MVTEVKKSGLINAVEKKSFIVCLGSRQKRLAKKRRYAATILENQVLCTEKCPCKAIRFLAICYFTKMPFT
jgi:hypothetical protein